MPVSLVCVILPVPITSGIQARECVRFGQGVHREREHFQYSSGSGGTWYKRVLAPCTSVCLPRAPCPGAFGSLCPPPPILPARLRSRITRFPPPIDQLTKEDIDKFELEVSKVGKNFHAISKSMDGRVSVATLILFYFARWKGSASHKKWKSQWSKYGPISLRLADFSYQSQE